MPRLKRIKIWDIIRQIRFWLPLLGGVIFWAWAVRGYHYSVLRCGFVILTWGVAAWGLAYVKRDPSWPLILHSSLFLFLLACLLLTPDQTLPKSLDLLTFPLEVTYVAAKIGCFKNKCCRAKRLSRSFNPISFNSFDWLQVGEILLTSLALLLLLPLLFFFGGTGIPFAFFLITHAAIRTVAYWYRYLDFSYAKRLLPLHVMYVLLILSLLPT
jgi:hypothetical protein